MRSTYGLPDAWTKKRYMTICCRIDGVETYNDMSGLSRELLKMSASSQISVLNFGYPATRTTFNSYLLRDIDGNYEIYSPYVWNHVCFSFTKGGYSRVVLVSDQISIYGLETQIQCLV